MVREDVKTIPKDMNHTQDSPYVTVEGWDMDFKQTRFMLSGRTINQRN